MVIAWLLRDCCLYILHEIIGNVNESAEKTRLSEESLVKVQGVIIDYRLNRMSAVAPFSL
jgi:hypothetical protein